MFYRHISFDIKFSDRLIASHWLLSFIKYCSTKSLEFRLNFISKHIRVLYVLNKYYFFCWIARSSFIIRCASEKSLCMWHVCVCDMHSIYSDIQTITTQMKIVLDQSRSNIQVATKSRCMYVFLLHINYHSKCSSLLQSYKLISATVAHSPLEIEIEMTILCGFI